MPNTLPSPHRSDARLTLVTLGATTLAVGDAPPAFTGGKPLALVAYLAAAPGRRAARDELLELLWADVEPEPGRHALRQTLWHVRRKLGIDPFAAAADSIALALAVDSDRDAFLAALDGGDNEAAVDRYPGDFFPGFAAPGGAEFERWADRERDRLRALLVRAGHTVVRRRTAEHRHRDAIALARRVRAASPSEQSGARLLVESLVAAGDHVAAAAEADRLERLAAEEELELEPSTRALLRAARHVPASPDTERQRTLLAELVGREREFAAALSAWEAARAGAARHVYITAPAGLGKSRLLTDLAARLRAARSRVVLVRATQAGREVPYAAAAELAGTLAGLRGSAGVSPATASALVALNPATSAQFHAAAHAAADSASGADALRRRSLAVGELLAAIAHESPVAVLIDDLHWADAESRQLFADLVARGTRGALVVTASRPPADTRFTGDGTLTVPLHPLQAGQVAALVTSLGALPHAAWADALPDRLHEASGGSPLLALETLQLALDRGALVLEDRRWRCPAPETLAELLGVGGPTLRRIEQLGDDARRALTVLAVAGTAVPSELLGRVLALAGTPVDAAATLEARGLALRSGDVLSVAHDEIAAAAIEHASTEELRDARAALGAAIADAPDASTASLRRAVRYLYAAGASTTNVAFGRLVEHARRAGDARPVGELAREAFGVDADPVVARAAVRALPLRRRIDHLPARSAAAAAFGLAMIVGTTVALTLALTHRAPPPDARMLLLTFDDPGAEQYVVELRHERWDRSPIQVGEREASLLEREFPAARRLEGFHSFGQMGREGWVVTRNFGDTGGVDLVLLRRDGTERRLTASPHDDNPGIWSPAGDRIAFNTGRWDAERFPDLAVLTIADASVRPLTRSPGVDVQIAWSDDGTRIAFGRRDMESGQLAACWTPPNGEGIDCVPLPGYRDIGPGAWEDRNSLVVGAADADRRALLRVRFDTRSVSLIDEGAEQYFVSPDAGWAACTCSPDGYSTPSTFVFRVAEPNVKRRIVDQRGDRLTLPIVQWALPLRDEPARRVTIEAPRTTARGVPTRLTAAALDWRGRAAPIDGIRWESLDPAIATVDSTGLLSPLAPGTAVVRASAGALRPDTARIEIVASSFRDVLREPWTPDAARRWRFYGDPWPRVVVGPGGRRAFWSAGDATNGNGAYLPVPLDAARGAGVEAWLSTPITRHHWQSTGVALAALDLDRLGGWNHRSGGPPSPPEVTRRTCAFGMPDGEGADAIAWGRASAGVRSTRVALARAAADSAWYRVRVQLFPDGRCGVAINGRVVALVESSVPIDRPFYVHLGGYSEGTRMLIGEVTAWEGVRLDVDWFGARTADRAAPDAPAAPAR